MSRCSIVVVACDEGGIDEPGSGAGGVGGGRRGTVGQPGLGDSINEAQYQRDKRTISNIINKDRGTARHFAFLIETGTLTKKRPG